MPSIKITNLTKQYYKKKELVQTALNGLNCSFSNGSINVIMGPSGCGKTTLLRCILGLTDYEGTITFDDIDIKSVSLKEKNIAYISQEITLLPHYTIFQNIAFPLINSGASMEECRKRVYDVSKKLGIEAILSRKPKEISLGQAQRVCIAKAIVKRAYLYLFDEPFSNLDEERKYSLVHDLRNLLKEIGATAIIVTHSVKEAAMISEHIFMMNEGQFIEDGSYFDLLDSTNSLTKALLQDGN